MERVVLAHRGEPMLYPKHLPDEIRIQVLGAGAACEPALAARGGGGWAGHAVPPWKTYRRRALVHKNQLGLPEINLKSRIARPII